MRKIFIAIVLITLLSGVLAVAEDFLQVDKTKYTNLPGFLGYKSNEFIVVLKDNVAVDHASDMAYQVALNHMPEFAGLARQFGVKKLRPQFIGSDRNARAATPAGRAMARHYKVQISQGDIDDAVTAYSKLPSVERVEKIGIHTLYATPNDTYYDDPPPEYPHDQWHYWDTYGISANTAWDSEAGDQTVLVGDLDIGTKYDHGDLGGSNPPGPNDAGTNGNIWVNTNEVPGNGVDDDGNGYVDDIIGWDFVDRTDWYSYPCIDNDCGGADNDPSDGDGHGTHTAGTIAAITNNGYSVAGVAGGFGDGTFAGGGNGVKIVPCRIGYVLDYWIYGATGVVIMDYVAEAMYYMAELKIAGWNVAAINCSFGSSNSGGLGAAADYLIAQDVVICVAAGNSSSSSADYLGSRGDCIDVGATDQSGNPASFTNYGPWVDIAAPGVEVLSTITDPDNPTVDYIAYMDGTSMACPHVAGVVGLLESYNPSLSATDKINIITDPANTKAYNGSLDLGAGIVDARKCLDAAGGGCDLAADFSGGPTSGCAGMTVNFTDLSTGTGIDGWSWTFGDGGNSTAQNPSYKYNTPGTYSVSLTVSSSSQGCNDAVTKTDYITVNSGPTAEFVGSPLSGTEPLTVNFTDQSTDATGWDWTFGDGGTSTTQNPSHTYTTAGTYTVTLTASNVCGTDVNQKVDYITVDPCVAPTADFSGTPTNGEEPLAVDFTDLSTGNPTSWSWDFGDGVGTSTAENPSYTYNSAGTYTVTLTATNTCGSDDEIKVDYITVTPCSPPTADFSGTPTSGYAPLTVDFSDLSAGATGWDWNFGDGGTSTAQNPSYTYTTEGTYTVTLTVTNACGSDVATKTDYITVMSSPDTYAYALSDIPVTGTVSGSYLDTKASDNVYETITEVQYTGHPRKTYSYLQHKWNFDVTSGSTIMFNLEAYRMDNAEGDNFVFEYSTDDVTYLSLVTVTGSTEQVYSASIPNTTSGTVYVRVTDSNRSWGNVSLDAVFIDEMYFVTTGAGPQPPVADFVASPTSGNPPLTVNFTDLSTGDPISWDWTFGDGGTSAAQNPSYTYNTVGLYTVTLTVTNANGSDVETKTDYINVYESGGTMHVENMVVGRAKSGPNYFGTCTVTIFDNLNNPVSDAAVYVTATGPTGGNYNGVTGADGTVYFETSGMKKPSGEWCFEVTNVTHATMTYDAGSNVVTQACESGPVAKGVNGVTRVLPTEFSLRQNMPNPFNPVTQIGFSLPTPSHVTLEIYNIMGQRVAILADHYYEAGNHSVVWDASKSPSGIYLYRIQAGQFTANRKMMLLK